MSPIAGKNAELVSEALDVYKARLVQRRFERQLLVDTLSTLHSQRQKLYNVSPSFYTYTHIDIKASTILFIVLDPLDSVHLIPMEARTR